MWLFFLPSFKNALQTLIRLRAAHLSLFLSLTRFFIFSLLHRRRLLTIHFL